jgi:thiamine pyrophosphate-dependent acetolactate synthase large subunit-like protein
MNMARDRGRPPENKFIGTRIDAPAVDFATLARGFGVHGEGPIERPEDLRPALERALAVVKSGKPALVDVITQPR